MAAQEKKDTLHGLQYVAQCVACAALTAGCSAINDKSLFRLRSVKWNLVDGGAGKEGASVSRAEEVVPARRARFQLRILGDI